MTRLFPHSVFSFLIVFGCYINYAFGSCPDVNASFQPSTTDTCSSGNVSISFINNSTGANASSAIYYWYRDGVSFDTTTALVSPKNNTLSSSGASIYTVIALDNSIVCKDTFSLVITYHTSSNADFSFSKSILCEGDSSVITSNSTGEGLTYSWDFGNTVTSSTAGPHTQNYTSAGSVPVRLAVDGYCGKDTVIQNIVVNAPPVAGFSFPSDSVCVEESFFFSNTSVGGITYTWDFGDGKNSTKTDTTYSYSATGTYFINLMTTNAAGCNHSTKDSIYVAPFPIVSISGDDGDGNTVNCLPPTDVTTSETVTLSNTTTGAVSYRWDFGDGSSNTTSSAADFTHNYTTYGKHTVIMEAVNETGCAKKDSFYVSFGRLPEANFTIPSTQMQGCSPHSVSPVNNSLNGEKFIWGFGDGTPDSILATFSAPSHVFIPGGSYVAELTVENFCGTSKTTVSPIFVGPGPASAFITDLKNGAGCAPFTVTFTNQSSLVSPSTNCIWDFGDGTIVKNVANPSPHTYLTNDTFNVKLTVGNACTTDTSSKSVIVHAAPNAIMGISASNRCSPDTVTVTNNSTGELPFYSWYINGEKKSNAKDLPQQIFSPFPGNNDSTYTIQLVDSNHCGVDDTTIMIKIHPKVVASFNATSTTVCEKDSIVLTNTSFGDSLTFAWDFGNTGMNSAKGPHKIAYSTQGSYPVRLVSTGYCGQDSTTKMITVNSNPVATFIQNTDTICALDSIFFENKSTGASIYNWTFESGFSSTAKDPSHLFSSWGAFNVQMVAKTPLGCTDTAVSKIVIDSIPTADFTSTTPCIGDSTFFTNTSSGTIVKSAWGFGDGDTDSLNQNSSHLYSLSADYDVKLTVWNAIGCSHSTTKKASVSSFPKAGFSFVKTCAEMPCHFTDTSSGSPTAWNWDFGDGSSLVSGKTPSHSYKKGGNYPVTLAISNAGGCVDTVAVSVFVDSIPTPNFTFSPVCLYDSTVFSSTSVGNPDVFIWNFDDGTSDSTHSPVLSHAYSVSGVHNVMLFAGYSSTGCMDTVIIPVEAYPRTIPGFKSTDPCLNLPVMFTDTTKGNPTSWTWRFGDTATKTGEQNTSHNYTVSGIYDVTLITENASKCIDSITLKSVVHPLPKTNFFFDPVCKGDSVVFTDSTTIITGNITSRKWNFDDATLATDDSLLKHLYTTDGQYNAKLISFSDFGCSDTSVKKVDVWALPKADFSPSTVCHTYSTTFTDKSLSATKWFWDFGDIGSVDSVSSPEYIYSSDGNFITRLVVKNNYGCPDTFYTTVTVLPQPQGGFTYTPVCARSEVEFTDTTTQLPIKWKWDFDDNGSESTDQHPSYTYQLGGEYSVQLITENAAGCIDTLTVPVTVYTNPTPGFSSDTACLSDITNFYDLSIDSVPITDYFWDFGDGNHSKAPNPLYIYQTDGTFQVSQTVTNIHGCDSSVKIPVSVYPVPKASYKTDTVCIGLPTTFTDLSSGSPVSWLWTFEEGKEDSTGSVTTYTYPEPGKYVTSLVVKNASGCADSVFNAVIVNVVVKAGIEVKDSSCFSDELVFSDTTKLTGMNVIKSYAWNFGDSFHSVLKSPTHVYDSTGIYRVLHSVTTSKGCKDSIEKTILVFSKPKAEFANTTPLCLNQPALFLDSSIVDKDSIVFWRWDFGNGDVSSKKSPTISYKKEGNFEVSLVVATTAGCSDTISHKALVYAHPEAVFTNDTSCYNDSTLFQDLSTISSGTISRWEWDFEDGTADSIQHPFHVFAFPNDSFYVSLVVTSDSNCTDTVKQLVKTHPIAKFNFRAMNFAGCLPFKANFLDQSTLSGSGFITNWVWNYDDGFYSYEQNPLHTFEKEGSFDVSLTVKTSQNCYYTDTLLFPVVVHPKPHANFNYRPDEITVFNPEVHFLDSSVGAVDWKWRFGDGTTSDEQKPTHTYLDTGDYTITQIIKNIFECSDTTMKHIRVLPEFSFHIPNAFTPGSDAKNDLFGGIGIGIKRYKMLVFDRWGSILFESNSIEDGWDGKIEKATKFAKDGLYLYQVIVTDVFGEEHEYNGTVTLLRK